nr:phage tail tape measure protein [Methylobacterium sp. OTU13CASTA1]
MATRTAHLVARLTDEVSGPAAKMAAGLKQAAAQAEALTRLSGKGGTGKFASDLRNLGASVSQIDAVTAAMKRYAQQIGASGNRADWTKDHRAQMRTWETSTVASLKSVIAAEREAGRAAGEMASAQLAAAVKAGEAARIQRKAATEQVRAHREAVRERRREAATTIVSGAGLIAAHKGKKIGLDSVQSAADFDEAVRKQRVFTDITPDDQASLLTQAKRVGQETKFSNEDVVKAQTASMQGLPANFSPQLKAAVAEGIVENVKYYATLMETDLKDGAEVIRSYLSQTGKDISTKEKAVAEANKATNQLVKMAKLGGMSGDDVGQFVKLAMSSGSTAGLTTDSLMSLAALAKRGGLRGDEAGTFVKTSAGKLVSPTKKGLAAFNAAGIDHSRFKKMPDQLSTSALEGQFRMDMGKGFTPAIRKRLDAINADKGLIGDQGRYTQAVVGAVGDILGKTKKGTVRASDAQTAAKAVGAYHKVAAQSVDVEGLLDALMKSNATLAQLNAIFTGAHGGKAAITARQWEEFKASRAEIAKAGDDPDYAKKKSDEVMAGVYGAVENLKGSWQNLINTIGTANEGLIKSTADMLGNAVDSFSKLDKTTQQALSLAGGGAALAGGAYGAFNLGKALLGFGGGAAALTGSAAALTTSAGLLDAAALRLAGGGIGAGIGAGAGAAAGGAAAGGAAVGGVSLGLGGSAVAVGALAGGALDMLTPGTNGGIGDALLGRDSSLQQSMKALAAERKAREALAGVDSPTIMGAGRTMSLPGGADPKKGFTSEYTASRGTLGDFLLGQEKKAIVLPQTLQRARAGLDQIQNPPAPVEAGGAARSVPLPPRRPVELGGTLAPPLDEAKRKADQLNATTIAPKGDGAGLAPLGTAADEAKAKLSALAGVSVAPTVNASSITAAEAAVDSLLAKLARVGPAIAGASSTVASGIARTGNVAQRLQNARTDTGM